MQKIELPVMDLGTPVEFVNSKEFEALIDRLKFDERDLKRAVAQMNADIEQLNNFNLIIRDIQVKNNE